MVFIETLLPFVGRWVERFLRKDLDPERTEWVLIAWEFCLKMVFVAWLERLSQDAEKDADEKIMYRGKEVSGLFPETCRERYSKFLHPLLSFVLSAFISRETCFLSPLTFLQWNVSKRRELGTYLVY